MGSVEIKKYYFSLGGRMLDKKIFFCTPLFCLMVRASPLMISRTVPLNSFSLMGTAGADMGWFFQILRWFSRAYFSAARSVAAPGS